MMTSVNPTPPRQHPPAWLCQVPAENWLHTVADFLGDVAGAEGSIGDDPLCSQIPLAFLRRVVADASLRAELEADPAAALERRGIRVDPETLPAEVTLPSSETLREALRVYCGAEAEAVVLKHAGFFGGIDD